MVFTLRNSNIKKCVVCIIAFLITLQLISLCNTIVYAKEKKIPVSGGAYKYKPTYWNKIDRVYMDSDGNMIKYGNVMRATNCYAYAFNLKKNPLNGKKYCIDDNYTGLQPGGLSFERDYVQHLPIGFKKGDVFGRVLLDMRQIKYKIAEMKGSGLYKKIKNKKTSLVCLVTTKKRKYEKKYDKKKKIVYCYVADYHWYRQDKDGYWSHKRGKTAVIRVDSKGNKIKNPMKCKRIYKEEINRWELHDGIEYKTVLVTDYTGDVGVYRVTRK